MSYDPLTTSSVQPTDNSTLHTQQAKAKSNTARLVASQIAVEEEFTDWGDTIAFNPMAARKKSKELKKRLSVNKGKKSEKSSKPADNIKEKAAVFSKNHSETDNETLERIAESIKDDDSPEEIIEKVTKHYKDPYIANQALVFLKDVYSDDKEKLVNIEKAETDYASLHKSAISAGSNINKDVAHFSDEGVATKPELREIYQDFVGTPRSPQQLFQELRQKYEIKKLASVLKFMLHSLGSDIKSKGPSIGRPLLERLFSEIKSLQTVLGVFSFFYSRMDSLKDDFTRSEIAFPKNIGYTDLADTFIACVAEKYPSTTKVLRHLTSLPFSQTTVSKLLICITLREAIRGVPPRLFRSDHHKNNTLMTFLEVINELEEMLEEESNVQS